MALIQTIEPEKAEGQAKEIYDFMMENAGVIPAPLQLASASPVLGCWIIIGNRFNIFPSIRIWDLGCSPVYVIWWRNNMITLSAPGLIGRC